MITFLFIFIAAMFNAVMDSIENEHIHDTIFRKLNKKFWYKRESWESCERFFDYPIDGWHISKSLMIVFMILAILSSTGSNIFLFILWGIVWNASFNLFYNHIFICKK